VSFVLGVLMQTETTILLYELVGPALIVPSQTGVTYRNHTGGHSCYQMKLEGYLVPIAGDRIELVQRLTAHFSGPKWGGWCSHRIDDETADEIDRLLAEVADRLYGRTNDCTKAATTKMTFTRRSSHDSTIYDFCSGFACDSELWGKTK
jgi:hypothetical protein